MTDTDADTTAARRDADAGAMMQLREAWNQVLRHHVGRCLRCDSLMGDAFGALEVARAVAPPAGDGALLATADHLWAVVVGTHWQSGDGWGGCDPEQDCQDIMGAALAYQDAVTRLAAAPPPAASGGE